MTAPRFSVIVLALNEEKQIEAALRAIRAQYRTDLEIILSDGGSDDHTIALARPLVDRVLSSKDVNLGAGRNKGARVARGDVLVFVDADTRLPPATLDVIEAQLQQGEVGGSFAVHWHDGDPHQDRIARFVNGLVVVARSLFLGAAYGPCMFFDREAFEALGGFREDRILEDLEMGRRAQWVLGRRLAFVKDYPVFSSARRFRALGFRRYVLRDLRLFCGDLIGLRPRSYHEQYDTSIR